MSDKNIIKEYDRPLPKDIEGLQKSLEGVCKVIGIRPRSLAGALGAPAAITLS